MDAHVIARNRARQQRAGARIRSRDEHPPEAPTRRPAAANKPRGPPTRKGAMRATDTGAQMATTWPSPHEEGHHTQTHALTRAPTLGGGQHAGQQPASQAARQHKAPRVRARRRTARKRARVQSGGPARRPAAATLPINGQQPSGRAKQPPQTAAPSSRPEQPPQATRPRACVGAVSAWRAPRAIRACGYAACARTEARAVQAAEGVRQARRPVMTPKATPCGDDDDDSDTDDRNAPPGDSNCATTAYTRANARPNVSARAARDLRQCPTPLDDGDHLWRPASMTTTNLPRTTPGYDRKAKSRAERRPEVRPA